MSGMSDKCDQCKRDVGFYGSTDDNGLCPQCAARRYEATEAELLNLRSLLSEVVQWGLASHHDPADDAKGEELMQRISAACELSSPDSLAPIRQEELSAIMALTRDLPGDTVTQKVEGLVKLLEAVGRLKSQASAFEEMMGNRRDVLVAEQFVFAAYDAISPTAKPTEEKAAPSGNQDSRPEAKTSGEAFRKYRRTRIAELADWHPGFDMTRVSVSACDREAGSPKLGDKIARNPTCHDDQWLVAKAYFDANFEPVDSRPEATPPPNALQEKTRMLVEAVGLLKQQAAEFESMLGNRRDMLAAEVIVFAHYDALLALKGTTQEEKQAKGGGE